MTSGTTWIAVAVAFCLVLFAFNSIIGRFQGPSAPRPWRRSPFKVGRSYRVLQTFQAMRDAFTAGEILVYRSQAYSLYDGVTGYFFDSPTDGRTRAWDVSDDEDLAAWKVLFEEVVPTPGPLTQK